MPEEIRGNGFSAIETLREHLKKHPGFLVEKLGNALLVRLKPSDIEPEPKWREAVNEVPSLQLSWFQLGYLQSIVEAHLHKQHKHGLTGPGYDLYEKLISLQTKVKYEAL